MSDGNPLHHGEKLLKQGSAFTGRILFSANGLFSFVGITALPAQTLRLFRPLLLSRWDEKGGELRCSKLPDMHGVSARTGERECQRTLTLLR